MKRKKDASRCGEGKIVALAALCLRFEGVRDRRTGPFPSPARNPALHLPGALNLPVPGHCHSLLIIMPEKVICYHRCEVVAIYDACDWDIRR
jgi:hypothetical protein